MKKLLIPDSEYDEETGEYVKFYRNTNSVPEWVIGNLIYYVPGVLLSAVLSMLPALFYEMGIVAYYLFLLGTESFEDLHTVLWNPLSTILMGILTVYLFIKQLKKLFK